MKFIPAHKAWIAFNFLFANSTQFETNIQADFSAFQLWLLKSQLPGICLEWRDSWKDGFIKTSNHDHVIALVKNPNILIDLFFELELNWNIQYIFYGKNDSLEFDYVESDTTIKALEDTVNNCIREPAIDWLKENEPSFEVLDEGWIAKILPNTR